MYCWRIVITVFSMSRKDLRLGKSAKQYSILKNLEVKTSIYGRKNDNGKRLEPETLTPHSSFSKQITIKKKKES